MRRFLLVLAAAAAVSGCGGEHCGEPASLDPAATILLRPDSGAFKTIPPDTFHVQLTTSAGDITIRVVRAWAPMGAYRFYNLVRNGFFDGARFYRVLANYTAQFGVSGRPAVEAAWRDRFIPDDPIRVSNTRGMVTFAQYGKDTRNTQLFINLRDNQQLDTLNFVPVGMVVEGWDVARRLNGEYGELQPRGKGPIWSCTFTAGNNYLSKYYPRLDSITRARVMEPTE